MRIVTGRLGKSLFMTRLYDKENGQFFLGWDCGVIPPLACIASYWFEKPNKELFDKVIQSCDAEKVYIYTNMDVQNVLTWVWLDYFQRTEKQTGKQFTVSVRTLHEEPFILSYEEFQELDMYASD